MVVNENIKSVCVFISHFRMNLCMCSEFTGADPANTAQSGNREQFAHFIKHGPIQPRKEFYQMVLVVLSDLNGTVDFSG